MTIDETKIPKNTNVLINLWSVHHDHSIFPDAENFDPNRFYDPEKNLFIKHEAVIPFSIGKRSCIGQSFSEIELFVYFANIIKSFKIEPQVGQTINFNQKLGITLAPDESPLLMFKNRF